MPKSSNDVLLALVSDLSRRRKRIMKREMGLGEKPNEGSGVPHEKKLFPPDLLSQRGHRGPDCRKSGPPMAKLRILSALCELDGLSQSKLALILSIRPQSLTELLGKMERDGLIARATNDADKREILVHITDAGRAKLSGYEDDRSQYAAAFFAPLDEAEKEQLIVLLGKLLANE